MNYEILNFDSLTGSIDVRFWTDDFVEGLVYRIDVPVVDGRYVDGSELEAAIMSFAPHGQISRLLSVRALEQPASIVTKIKTSEAVNEQDAINSQAKAYLASTDWMVIRFIETGVPVPTDVTASRKAARELVVTN